MKNKLLLMVISFPVFLSSCMETEQVGCPLPYPIRQGAHEIYNTWALVGVRKDLRRIEFPPCELYINEGGKATLGRIRITFTEEASWKEEMKDFQTFLVAGPVNAFFGEFRLFGNNAFESGGEIGTTSMASVHANVNDYEAKLYSTLRQMTHFNLIHNQLVITFGEGREEMLWVLIDN